ncbi:MAG: methyltransferase domain-containing protein, partial [Chloroflexi bacterium]
LTQQRLLEAWPAHSVAVICLDAACMAIEQQEEQNPERLVSVDHVASVIYTSGSTGKPKGVVTTHRAMLNRFAWMWEAFPFEAQERCCQKTSLSFVDAVWEMFGPLLRGISIVLIADETLKDTHQLIETLSREQITRMVLVPSLLRVLLDTESDLERHLPDLKYWTSSGEALSVDLAMLFLKHLPQKVLLNLYGSSEVAADATCYEIRQESTLLSSGGLLSVPIGRPIANTEVYLLDAAWRLVPIGVPGEVYIGGANVARGYWRRADLTAERFLPHPWSQEPGARLYRTGDLARYLPDGAIEYLGRIDHQVKLRGFRIEMGEIEAILSSQASIQESVVVVREDRADDKQLIAYVVPALDAGEKQAWELEQIEQWCMLYDETYHNAAFPLADPTLNLSGWNSSYTGLPIPTEEMREQIEQTVTRILDRSPQRVVEIGVGTGMLLFRIAPHTRSYLASDPSAQALDFVQRTLSTHPLPQVRLVQQSAHEALALPPESVDAVIINSVVQYFPDIAYLLRVLQGALAVLQPGGFLFIGDVRSLPLFRAYATSVELYHATDPCSRAQVRQRVEQRLLEEEELLIDPAFFQALPRAFPQLGQVWLQLKRGRTHNELTRYRYDVVLRKAATEEALAERTVWDWHDSAVSYTRITEYLSVFMPDVLHIRRMPNSRLQADLQAMAWIEGESGPETVGQWRREQASRVSGTAGLDPEALWELGERLGYQVSISGSMAPSLAECEVVMSRGTQIQTRLLPACMSQPLEAPRSSPRWSSYVNNPLQGKMAQTWLPRLRQWLAEQLPEYMIPAHLVILESLPRTPNGKVHRQALPAPDRTLMSRSGTFVAAQTRLQEQLVAIWAELLHLSQIGIHDNFFEIGGHSLLATQLVSRLRQILEVELPLRSLFEAPTVASLAHHLEGVMQTAPSAPAPALVALPRPDELPLSFAQERLWFLHQWAAESAWYNIALALRLTGPLQLAALAWSLASIVQRHEVLRTTIEQRAGQPVQVIAEQSWLAMPVIDLQGWVADKREQQVSLLQRVEAERPFDLSRGPLWRVWLLKLDAEEHVLLLTLHHIVADGWSMGVLMREMRMLYQARITGQSSPLPGLSIQYADYAIWQRAFLQGAVLEQQLAYWKQQLADLSPLCLPSDHQRPRVQTERGATLSGQLSKGVCDGLQALCQKYNVTLFMLLLAAFQVLLMRYSGSEDVAVGTPIANRNSAEVEDLIGFFVNTLVMRSDLSGNPTFVELLQRVREVCLQAYLHQDLPFEKVVEAIEPERDMSRTPLFQVMFVLQNTPGSSDAVWDLAQARATPLRREGTTSKFDLTLYVVHREQGLNCVLEYSTDLFEVETMSRLLGHWQTQLEGIVANPQAQLSDLPLLTEAEREQLLVQWNATQRDYPQELCVHQLFERQVQQTPEAIALVFEDGALTYADLNRRANQLAHHLQSITDGLATVGSQLLVGICMQRSIAMVVALLAALKAGGAYIPFDPDHPAERLTWMLMDARPVVVLTQTHLMTIFSLHQVQCICLDACWDAIACESSLNPTSQVAPQHLAYVLYTSGSTGTPKGVMVS